ncbi:NfeD family protein [Solitalea koreensis]|uniref:Nodulation efficiency protein NfeD n=1 Tax=Solitalea koreensis TaxID=543615 RepID=A0A521CJW1_9SPHI|nr:nodulation protein NfeD [Solitalea koreensis]SMO59749.1 Nodulation efficiency protein NfeD [Solitalea koreensis]
MKLKLKSSLFNFNPSLRLAVVTLLILIPFELSAQKGISITVDGTINPSSAAYIHRGIEQAKIEKAECLLIHLNTPGGLLASTRKIVSDILESPVPVVVYVSPGGAHAGSAGVFITLAANVAAMAPGTNIGAAHPVDMQGQRDTIMNDKATNDAAAFIRTIAEKRKRNLQWAEEAVRKSLAITENEALSKNVIDLIAKNDQELLNQINGRSIELTTGTKILNTKNAEVKSVEMGAPERILSLLSDPNIAYLLFLLGLYGILFELYNPGAILPGIVGVIALLLALYSMNTLPINYVGLALIIFAIILFLLEIKVVSHGLLAIGGVVSLFFGSLMLIRSDSSLEYVSISKTIIISSVVTTAFFFLSIIGIGLRAQRLKPVTGVDGLVGELGEALETLNPNGTVRVHGEVWNAESISGRINQGEKILVVEMKNLKLYIRSTT